MPVLVAALALQSAPSATAPRADPTPAELFDRAVQAVGPVAQVPFLRAEGTLSNERGTSSLEVLWCARAPRRLLVRERSADGALNETGCDGTRGWMRLAGREGALEVEPAAVIAGNAGLVPPLLVLALADRFPHRTLGPEETLEGVACRRLELEDRDGVPGAAWFEAKTGRLHAFRVQARRDQPAMTTTISEWTTVGPLTVPSALRSVRDTRTTTVRFTRFMTDPIDDAAFKGPASP